VAEGGAGADPAVDLQGRSALVTGASRGIGLAIARALRDRGAWVGMVARSAGPLRTAADGIGGRAFPADAASAEAVAELGRRVREELGGAPNFVINAAGAFALGSIADTSAEEFDRQLAANLRAPFLVIREFLGSMLARRSGHLVSIGSVAGRVAFPGNGAYGASKYGLRGLHEVLAEEIRGSGVRATLIEPAATDTPLWDPLDPDARPDLPSRAAMLKPEEVARAVEFVVSLPESVEVSLLALRSSR
jgi:NAD(P)-dependent dehydrogenase (short-subunit alcohol dehydrogenase family)